MSGHFVSICCDGETCRCGQPASHKVSESIPFDDPVKAGQFLTRHPFTAYVCCSCFRDIMGDAVACDEQNEPQSGSLLGVLVPPMGFEVFRQVGPQVFAGDDAEVYQEAVAKIVSWGETKGIELENFSPMSYEEALIFCRHVHRVPKGVFSSKADGSLYHETVNAIEDGLKASQPELCEELGKKRS